MAGRVGKMDGRGARPDGVDRPGQIEQGERSRVGTEVGLANALDDAVDLRRPLLHSPLVLGKREEPEAPPSRHGDLQAERAGTDRGRLAHDAKEKLAQVVQVGVVARALHDKGLLRGRVRHAPDAEPEPVEHEAGVAGDRSMPGRRELGG